MRPAIKIIGPILINAVQLTSGLGPSNPLLLVLDITQKIIEDDGLYLMFSKAYLVLITHTLRYHLTTTKL